VALAFFTLFDNYHSPKALTTMKIGIDTLFEDPIYGSSATDYLASFVRTLARVATEHLVVVFVSFRNRHLFATVEANNLCFVNCLVSNEYILPRIIVQQTLLPLHAARLRLDLLYAPGNVCPLVPSSWRTVLKISTLHHYLTPEALSPARRIYRQLVFAAAARRADRIIANSLSTKNGICRLMNIPEEKVIVVPEAVDESFQRVERNDALASRLRTDYGLPMPYILFASALYPYKGADTLIRAFARVNKWHNNLHLAIAGPDPLSQRGKLEALALSLGIADQVHFLGRISNVEMPLLYSGAEVFVYPTLSETFGKPVVEAMRCEVPIIASNVDSIPEIVDTAGILVDPRDIEEIANAICRVLSDDNLRTVLVARGRVRAKDFSWERHTHQILKVCEDTVHYSQVPRRNAE